MCRAIDSLEARFYSLEYPPGDNRIQPPWLRKAQANMNANETQPRLSTGVSAWFPEIMRREASGSGGPVSIDESWS